MDNYKSRKNYITLLSVVSAFAVVLLHSNGCFWSFSRERYWITANIIDAVFYFAIMEDSKSRGKECPVGIQTGAGRTSSAYFFEYHEFYKMFHYL